MDERGRATLLALLRATLPTVGTFGTVVALIVTLKRPDTPFAALQLMLIFLAITGFVLTLILEVTDTLKARPQVMRNADQIRDYMYAWIARAGRVAIFTHDMTWVRDTELKDLLKRKAREDELILCLPKRTALAQELDELGATVYSYSQLNYIPRSRFTIIKLGRGDAEVAVGRDVSGSHVIEQFQIGRHPAFTMAEDLVSIIARINNAGSQEGRDA